MSELQDNDVGAIWVMKSKKGRNYLSMSIEIDGKKHQFVAFKNKKAKPTHPDYRIYPSKPREKKPEYEEPDPLQDENALPADGTDDSFPF